MTRIVLTTWGSLDDFAYCVKGTGLEQLKVAIHCEYTGAAY